MFNVVLRGHKSLSLTAGLREDRKVGEQSEGRYIIWTEGEEAHGDWRKTA